MPKRRLPYVLRESSRHGRMRWYFRKGKGKRVRLPDEYGSPEFLEAYNAALTQKQLVHSHRTVPQDCLEWLVRQWKLSSDWENASKATKRQRDNILRHVLDSASSMPFREVTKHHIKQGMDDRRHTPFAANNFLKTMRALFRWAVDADLVDADPTTAVKMFSKQTDGFVAWTEDNVAAYQEAWPLGTRERLAMELLLNTGFRRGDIVKLGRQHIREGYISLVTEKTAERVDIPLNPKLATVIEASPTGDLTFIVSSDGRPMAKESFGNWFRRACNTAGVKGSAHGLRKLAAVDWQRMA